MQKHLKSLIISEHTDGLYAAYAPSGAAIKTIWVKFFLDEKTLLSTG